MRLFRNMTLNVCMADSFQHQATGLELELRHTGGGGRGVLVERQLTRLKQEIQQLTEMQCCYMAVLDVRHVPVCYKYWLLEIHGHVDPLPWHAAVLLSHPTVVFITYYCLLASCHCFSCATAFLAPLLFPRISLLSLSIATNCFHPRTSTCCASCLHSDAW